MPKHWTSQNVRASIPILHHDSLSVKEISSRLGVKESLVYLVLKLYRQFGIVSNVHKYSCTVGRPHSLSQADVVFISALLDHRRSLYLDELQDELQLKCGIHTTLPTIHRALQRLGISHKIISVDVYE